MPKVLITGANGQLGTALKALYPKAICTDVDELDITSKKSVENFDWSEIDTVINAAAYTNVDGAETPENKSVVWQVNAVAVANLAQAALKYDFTVVHISTDYVFDGEQEIHDEDEPFSPLSVYGESKAAGDIALSIIPKHYIIRTSWVIGSGNNFVKTMQSLAEKNISPTVVADQIGRLTFTKDLAAGIKHLLDNNAPHGTYNLSNKGESASWADITREIFACLDRNDLTVTDTTTEEYFKNKPGIAPRPLKSTLKLDKIKSVGFMPRDWREALKDYLK
jgi:dTDP-4-dehydrorhamnose 3,5-epimerase